MRIGWHSESTSDSHRRIVEAGLRFQEAERRRKEEAEQKVLQAQQEAAERKVDIRRRGIWQKIDSAMASICSRGTGFRTLHQIATEVCIRHNITLFEMRSASRGRTLARARQEAYFLCVQETTHSLPVIGRFFHKDHTTIAYGVMRHARLNKLQPPRAMNGKYKGQRWEG